MFALMGAMAGLSLAFGPTLSGWVAQVLNWRYIFAAQGLLLTLSWLLMFISRNLTRHELCVQGTFDWQAAFLFFGLIASVVSAMVLTSTDDSGALLAIIAGGAGAICLIGLIIRERRASFPLLNFRLVSQPRFLGVVVSDEHLLLPVKEEKLSIYNGHGSGCNVDCEYSIAHALPHQ